MHASAASALRLLMPVLDFALPPRCGGCGAIVDEVDSFCADCWTKIEFLGAGGCSVCGLPLEGTEIELCGRCLARPPRLERIRSATAYGEISRGIALKLKHGRKVALGRTMARFMAPLVGELPDDALLVPVPLHRRRVWSRGFNQSAIVARELARRIGAQVALDALQRVKSTPPLKGMSMQQRRRAVAGAIRANPKAELRGRTVVLIDDVLTTGSTANACARALRRAGAKRVELISWARVVRPSQLD
jgi:ComF family protein